jgi:hypothetical protein
MFTVSFGGVYILFTRITGSWSGATIDSGLLLAASTILQDLSESIDVISLSHHLLTKQVDLFDQVVDGFDKEICNRSIK